MRAYLGCFRPTLPAQDPRPMQKFAQWFFGFLTWKRVFRALAWLASISGSKDMAQKPKNGQTSNFAPTNAILGGIWPLTVTGHNSPSEWAREPFKPSKDSQSHVVFNKKNILILDFGFSVDVYIMRGCLCIFGFSLMTSSSLPLRPAEPFFWHKVFFDFRPNLIFWGVLLIFLAFLDHKLGPMNGKLIREIPGNGLADR